MRRALHLRPGYMQLLSVHPVGRGLRLGGGGDDSALVVLQDGEPTCQVGGGVIARIMSHAEIGAKE